ncbi:hypothetical protein GCM10007901_33310 [Dyella acidisoli]|uniref:Uncharacterized protein n=1 Tax=Dyella acidisoli TaxID=1867834 RepID=A0ABQ5XRL7_9GAMM|nr:hypothetical protein GCM10007901_33310 [Dyella acidisoli]
MAIYLLTPHKNSILAMAVHRQRRVSYNTVWLLKQKQMQAVMLGKTPLAVTVQCSPLGHPIMIRMDVVKGFRKAERIAWASHHLTAGSTVVTGGLECFLVCSISTATTIG